ncbi:MAG: hypothetical protein ABII01_01700 [Candidatus Woesearchaeota archaeon]
MSNIADTLRLTRRRNEIGLDSVCLEEIGEFDTSSQSRKKLRLRIVQELVERWLCYSEGVQIESVPEGRIERQHPNDERIIETYTCIKRNNVFYVTNSADSSLRSLRFNYFLTTATLPYVVRIEERKLNGVRDEILHLKKVGRIISGQDECGVLIFVPFYSARKVADIGLEKRPNVHCIDIGFSQADLDQTVSKYFEINGKGYHHESRGHAWQRRKAIGNWVKK